MVVLEKGSPYRSVGVKVGLRVGSYVSGMVSRGTTRAVSGRWPYATPGKKRPSHTNSRLIAKATQFFEVTRAKIIYQFQDGRGANWTGRKV